MSKQTKYKVVKTKTLSELIPYLQGILERRGDFPLSFELMVISAPDSKDDLFPPKDLMKLEMSIDLTEPKKSKWHLFGDEDWRDRVYPNDDRRVLVLLDNGKTVDVDRFQGLAKWLTYDSSQVIGWRELPKPPERSEA